MADQDAGEGPAESEWRFPLSAFDGDDEEQAAQPSASASAEGPAEEADDGQAGADSDRIEPGDPTLEGTLFVLLGVAVALFVLSRLVVG
jgi:hypothetical protein